MLSLTLISDLRVLLVPVFHVPLLVKVSADGVFDKGLWDEGTDNPITERRCDSCTLDDKSRVNSSISRNA